MKRLFFIIFSLIFTSRLDAFDHILRVGFRDRVADVVALFLQRRLFSSVGSTNQQTRCDALQYLGSYGIEFVPGNNFVELSFERIRQYFEKNERHQMWDYIFLMLEQGADGNATDENGRTVLFYITYEDREYLQKLIAIGVDVHREDRYGNTALEWFCKQHFSNHDFMTGATGSQVNYSVSKEMDCFMEFLDGGARIESCYYLYYQAFRRALQSEKFAVAQKIYDIYPILRTDKEYLSSLIRQYETASQFRFLKNLIDILQIDELLQRRNLSRLAVLIEKYPDKFTSEQLALYDKLVRRDKNLDTALEIFGVACFVLFIISTKSGW